MSIDTKIQWCDSTLNLQMGCDGCELWGKNTKKCYAGTLTNRHAGKNGWPDAFEKPKLFVERLQKAIRWPSLAGVTRPTKSWIPASYPRLIFLDDMGDTFTESLPTDWLAPHLPIMENSPHIYILLTKRPARMADFFSRYQVPKNFWLCTSITNKASLKRIEPLLDIKAAVKGLSIEPLWEELNLKDVKGLDKLQWVKIGGESGTDANPCDLDWIRNAANACKEAGMAVFIKQLGTSPILQGFSLKLNDYHGGDWTEWDAALKIREMPSI